MDRDGSGRWKPGHSGNPGGMPKGLPGYRKAVLAQMRESVSADDWDRIFKRAVKQATEGDHRARSWLSDYLLGKPDQIAGGDGDAPMSLEAWLERADERIRRLEQDT